MKPLYHIREDAATLRGIVALLEEGPATTRDAAITQHVGSITAGRCCRALQQAGIIAHPTVARTILGMSQDVPQLAWELTGAYRRGEIDFNAEAMAGGV